MKKVMICTLFGLLLSSCVSSYKPSSGGEYSEFNCLQPKEKMYLLKTYNTCPAFSLRPLPESSIWQLFSVTKANRKYLEESNEYENKVFRNIRDCSLPTRVTISRIIDLSQKISINEIVARSDSQSSQSLFLAGVLNMDGLNYPFSIRLEDGYGEKIGERILKQFNLCESAGGV